MMDGEKVETNPAAAPKPPAPVRFTLTERAVAHLRKLLADRKSPDAGLRVAVRGGGCSGLSYAMEWADAPKPRDKIAERDGIRVFIDPKSYLYLTGTELDYEETLLSAGLKLNNPNVKSSCGCGESFSV